MSRGSIKKGKLKCWKKTKEGYKRKDGEKSIIISRAKPYPNFPYDIVVERKTEFPAFRYHSLSMGKDLKDSKKKAMSYMKKHNVC